MTLVNKPFRRSQRKRDSRFIFIATEGQAEIDYFNELKNNLSNHRIKMLVIERNNKATSSPKSVLNQLKEIQKKPDVQDNDEFWMVFDHDKWSQKEMSKVAAEAKKSNIFCADSKPCFEIWLLLHFKSFSQYSKEEKERLLTNRKINKKKTVLETELSKVVARGYNKYRINAQEFLPYIKQAVERAEKADVKPKERWLNTLGSRVYRLIKRLDIE